MTEITDIELINRYKSSRDLKVLGELYERYMPLVFGVCLKYLKNREDSQDAVMQVFEKLIDQLQKHEVANFKSWLHVLAKNHCLMKMRSEKGKHSVEIENNASERMEFSIAPHHSDDDEKEVDLTRLNGCLEQLSEEQKKCVDLFFLQEKSYNQVVESSGYELKKVKSYIQNGKRNLKNCMENHGA